jgi:elongation factor P
VAAIENPIELEMNLFHFSFSLHIHVKRKSIAVSGKILIDLSEYSAGVKVDEVRIERRPFQYLYKDDMGYNFMNTETFEQIPIPAEQIEGVQFLKEGDIVEVQIHAESGTILTAEMPVHVVLEVTYTEPGIKGDTATNTLKPATLETGAEVRVPLFIDTGEKIKVDTRNGSYVERVR